MKKTFVLALAALALSASVVLAALTLDAAKAQGVVGEKPDGLIGAVTSSPEADALVSSTNAERMERYKSIAAKNGTAVSQVQALAGKKLIEQAAKGEYVMNGSSWVKK
jgi:uncharacterized protein YdbL (DUF1318 family)